MPSSVTNPVKALALIALGLAIAAMGIYVANADDAPGAAVIGFLGSRQGRRAEVQAAGRRQPGVPDRQAASRGLEIGQSSRRG